MLTTFQNTLLGGAKVSSVATQEASEGLMQNAVKKDANGIGFLSDYFALAKGINAVGYNGTGCTVANVVSGTYPGTSDFYEVTKGPAEGRRSEAFIYWIQTSSTRRRSSRPTGSRSARSSRRQRLATTCSPPAQTVE